MIKILYLEDEHFLGRIVSESLEGRGFGVKLIQNGAAFMEALRNYEPDICVLDVMVPKIDGFALAKEIRVLLPKMPIVFLTAKTQISDVLKGFESGGNDYIKKPFSMEELIVRINNLLTLNDANSNGNINFISFGTFLFYPSKFELHTPKEVVKLSHKENELFKLLTTHINNNIDRRMILKNIWGDDSMYNSRNLDVYINKIRKMLEEDGSVELITLRGYGYHFVVKL